MLWAPDGLVSSFTIWKLVLFRVLTVLTFQTSWKKMFPKQWCSVHNNPYIASGTTSLSNCYWYWVSTPEAKCENKRHGSLGHLKKMEEIFRGHPQPIVGSFWAVEASTAGRCWGQSSFSAIHWLCPSHSSHVSRRLAAPEHGRQKVEPNKRWNLNQVPKAVVSPWKSETLRGLWTIYRSLVRGRSHILSE